jgi:beta-glucosidase
LFTHKKVFLVAGLTLIASCSTQSPFRKVANTETYAFPFRNPHLPLEDRVDDLISRMSLSEKVQQMDAEAFEISRLGIPAYSWQNEALHGLKSYNVATTNYPQVIGLASTWNPSLIHEIATAVSDEARAAHHDAVRKNEEGECTGLNLWSPNINIFRDPRWGRGQETYGEDPFLTSRMSVEYIKGLQGDNPKYLKTVATPKHFAVYSGPEKEVSTTNIEPTDKDFQETYLPAFEYAIREGRAHSVMCAYTSLKGAPACANSLLLTDLLRQKWGFEGVVTSDCGAIGYIWERHKYTTTPMEGAVKALRAGTDMACKGVDHNRDFSHLEKAVTEHLEVDRKKFTEKEIDVALARILTLRFKLGMFDPDSKVEYSKIPMSVINSKAHRNLSLKAARETMVLLKNHKNILPLSKTLKKISVIGPNADNGTLDSEGKAVDVLLGTYHGEALPSITPLAGIRKKVSHQTKIIYKDGSKDLDGVEDSDVAILFLGLQPIEDDVNGNFPNAEGEGRDRVDSFDFPPEQIALMKKVEAMAVPMVVVLINGSALASVYMKEASQASLEAWYPGQEGGTAVADVLFGDYNPAGRLPITFYKSTDDLPPFRDYKMAGRTYRYFKGEPLFPFGYGLSYTNFKYSELSIDRAAINVGDDLDVSVDVENTGDRAGDEVVQVYISSSNKDGDQPIRSLKAFRRIHLRPGDTQTVKFKIKAFDLTQVSINGKRSQVPGVYSISIGGQQPVAEAAQNVVGGTFEVR